MSAPQNRRYVEGQQLCLRTCQPKLAATIVVNNETYYRRWSSQRERFKRSSREAALDMFVFQSLREIGEQTDHWLQRFSQLAEKS